MEKIRVSFIVLSLTYAIAFVGFLSIFPYIDTVFSLFFISTFFIAVFSDLKDKHPVPGWLLNTLSLLAVFITIPNISISDLVKPVVELLTVLLGIKLLEKKKFRDFMQVYLISTFLLAGSALLNISLSFLIFFLLLFFMVVISIVFLTYYTEEESISLDKDTFFQVLLRTLLIPVLSIPITVILFLVLPRTDYPLFSFLNRTSGVSTGFSDSVSLGDVSDIQEDTSVAFRVKMKKISSQFLYWRGTTLNRFDGRIWKREKIKEKETVISGLPVVQKIYKEPSPNRYLFGLNVPYKITGIKTLKEPDFVFLEEKNSFKRKVYTVLSRIGGIIKPEGKISPVYLQLPEKIKEDSQIKALANSLKGRTPEETVKNILNFLKKNYTYSISNLPTESPLKDFLFKEKKGNCEFFASAAAVLLRFDGIPSRLVAGYKGGNYNRLGGYYIVSQKDAHVWIEAYLNGFWVSFDPTPPVSSKGEKGLQKVLTVLDIINYYWINMVINFDFKKQISIIKGAKSIFSNANFRIFNPLFAKIIIILIIFFTFVLYFLYKKYETYLIVNKFLRKLKKYGYVKREKEGIMEFVGRIEDERIRKKAEVIVNEILEILYGKAKTADKKKRIKQLIKKL